MMKGGEQQKFLNKGINNERLTLHNTALSK
jgi:hypothetical protein